MTESEKLNGARDYAMWDAAYVLGALSDSDRREYESHLEGCIECRTAVTELAPGAAALAGMSLGGLTSILLADRHPELVRRHVLVDITPGVTGAKSQAVTDFIGGPESFESFEEILDRTIAFNP